MNDSLLTYIWRAVIPFYGNKSIRKSDIEFVPDFSLSDQYYLGLRILSGQSQFIG